MSVPGILAAVVGDPAVAGLPRDTPLLSGGLGLDSVTVVRLLAEIRTATGLTTTTSSPASASPPRLATCRRTSFASSARRM